MNSYLIIIPHSTGTKLWFKMNLFFKQNSNIQSIYKTKSFLLCEITPSPKANIPIYSDSDALPWIYGTLYSRKTTASLHKRTSVQKCQCSLCIQMSFYLMSRFSFKFYKVLSDILPSNLSFTSFWEYYRQYITQLFIHYLTYKTDI